MYAAATVSARSSTLTCVTSVNDHADFLRTSDALCCCVSAAAAYLLLLLICCLDATANNSRDKTHLDRHVQPNIRPICPQLLDLSECPSCTKVMQTHSRDYHRCEQHLLCRRAPVRPCHNPTGEPHVHVHTGLHWCQFHRCVCQLFWPRCHLHHGSWHMHASLSSVVRTRFH